MQRLVQRKQSAEIEAHSVSLCQIVLPLCSFVVSVLRCSDDFLLCVCRNSCNIPKAGKALNDRFWAQVEHAETFQLQQKPNWKLRLKFANDLFWDVFWCLALLLSRVRFILQISFFSSNSYNLNKSAFKDNKVIFKSLAAALASASGFILALF